MQSSSYIAFVNERTFDSLKTSINRLREHESKMTSKQWKKIHKIIAQIEELTKELKPKV